jgi:hypothetical protein
MIGYPTRSATVSLTAGQTATTNIALPNQPLDLDAMVVTGQGGEISKRRIATTVEVVYLMRQEIFLAEGRRQADLGIRMPVAQTEILANPRTRDGEPYTRAQVGTFIPLAFEMDAFTYDQAARTAVIRHDMNRVLVTNRTSPFVLPFH